MLLPQFSISLGLRYNIVGSRQADFHLERGSVEVTRPQVRRFVGLLESAPMRGKGAAAPVPPSDVYSKEE